MFMARYANDGGDYRGTVTVRPLEPTTGFEDKPAIAVDVTGGRHDGTVYAAWTDFAGFQGRVEFCTAVYFARSTDGGRSFERAVKISGPQLRDVSSTWPSAPGGPCTPRSRTRTSCG